MNFSKSISINLFDYNKANFHRLKIVLMNEIIVYHIDADKEKSGKESHK